MSGQVHFNEDIACVLSALSMANRIPTSAPDTREVRLYRAGFQAGLRMVAEALGIVLPVGANNPPLRLEIASPEAFHDGR